MTQGSIPKAVVRFAVPCILVNVLQNLAVLADSAVMGSAGGMLSLAAVGACGAIVSLFTSTALGLASGFGVAAGKAFGAGDTAKLRRVFASALFVDCLVTLAVTLFGAVFSRLILTWMQTPAELLDDAAEYLTVIFLGIGATFFYDLLGELLRAVGNSRAPLCFLIVSFALHLLLLWVFVFRVGLDVTGAALATVLSQAVAVLFCAVTIKARVPALTLSRADLRPDRAVLAEGLRVGLPMALTNFVVAFGVIILGFVTNGIGTRYVAAYSVASRIGYILTTPLFGFASTGAVFASQNLGANKPARIRKGLLTVVGMALASSFAVLLLILFAARPLVARFLPADPVAVDAGVLYLKIRCTAAFALSFAAIAKSALVGLAKPFVPTLSGFVEIAVRYVFPLSVAPFIGFAAVPLTDAVIWLILALMLTPTLIHTVRKLMKQEE